MIHFRCHAVVLLIFLIFGLAPRCSASASAHAEWNYEFTVIDWVDASVGMGGSRQDVRFTLRRFVRCREAVDGHGRECRYSGYAATVAYDSQEPSADVIWILREPRIHLRSAEGINFCLGSLAWQEKSSSLVILCGFSTGSQTALLVQRISISTDEVSGKISAVSCSDEFDYIYDVRSDIPYNNIEIVLKDDQRFGIKLSNDRVSNPERVREIPSQMKPVSGLASSSYLLDNVASTIKDPLATAAASDLKLQRNDGR